LGCRGPRISLNLYLAIALALAVLLGLAGAHIKFAAETIRAAHRVHGKGLQALVDAASLAPTRQSVAAAAAAYQVISGELAELLRTLEHRRPTRCRAASRSSRRKHAPSSRTP